MGDDGLTAGAVARRLGIAVTTLRTWHQRYGLGPSRHESGRHRRYTEEDLARLEVMRRLTAEGVPAAEAARFASRTPVPGGVEPASARGPSEASTVSSNDLDFEARHGGGHSIALGYAAPAARGLATAAMRLDAPAMRELITSSIAEVGVIQAWSDLLVPVLVGIGERYAATGRYVEVEHLLSRSVSEALGTVTRPVAYGVSPQVLLACADEEQHSLPLEALAAALAERGAACRLLGARVPAAALADAVARTAPLAVVLWSQLPSTGSAAQLHALMAGVRHAMLLIAAGPGWDRHALPAGTAAPNSLDDAVALVLPLLTRSGTGVERVDRVG
ncbi:DNA-binding transcriptional MerR regulator/methanogenic corrinoid protein MtbC1 [Catenuloplanes nepalensis]|uniref:DNA-binding transcriptional MerR regulator/methanogenic corrinoid protein MtbC1 n=1 Tax=Catenuloplanes nepalensis TaxID=587533 RepID=A0ABT9N483_9ACTN|nr:MerR family transcriptional regulator [Catenuloplanes nepalensis]MDP9798318.1 DNA-binding transcriptional MerR regulator/methanogenic corrinoid protein MtbC1 [Catenuloplanes nepalensis]